MYDAPQKKRKALQCPSAPANAPDARVFGVVLGSAHEPRVAYLDETVAMDDHASELAEGLDPTELFRLTSRCFESACVHFADAHCSLGDEIAATRDAVAVALPPCSIRVHCRWFAEQGSDICLRCPSVVTSVPTSSVKPGDKTFRRLKVVL